MNTEIVKRIAMSTAISIASQGFLALFIPIGAVISICSTFPKAVIGAAHISITTLAAAIKVSAFWSGYSSKLFTAMGTDKYFGRAYSFPLLDRCSLRTLFGNKVIELTAAYRTSIFSSFPSGNTPTSARTTNLIGMLRIFKGFFANGASLRLGHSHTSDSMFRENEGGRVSRIKRLSVMDQITQAPNLLYINLLPFERRVIYD